MRIVSKQLIIVLGLLTTVELLAQTESKTFQERFIVAKDAVVDINTSYADIEFETWDKDEVAIMATITLDGATKEEVQKYFEKSPIEILGNSKEVRITSKSNNDGLFTSFDTHFEVDYYDMPIEIPEIASFVMNVPQIAPFPEMPPLPKTDAFTFDYEAYQEDGDKYMKKWQKNFEKSFDKKHQKRLEEWAERMEERAVEIEKRMEEQSEKREELLEKRHLEMQHRIQEREEKRALLKNERDELRQFVNSRKDSVRNAPNIFYYSKEGEHKKYKITKTIKIYLPKSTRIKMNVRHGEVELAENTKDLNANLSHSSLWATSIEGENTNVSVSYTPVRVQQWNYGQLNTSYSEEIDLSEVVHLQLQATSSDVTIKKLFKNAAIKNNFGAVHILELGHDFEELDISVKNGELNVRLPEVATNVYVKGNSSTLKLPTELQLVETKNGTSTIHKGFHLKDTSNRSIVITSDYSEVVLQ